MTQQTPYPPAQAQYAPPQPRNGLGTAGFVLGLVGLVLSPIPLIGVVAWPLVIIGLVLSAIGFARTRKGIATNKGLAITGMVTSIIGLVICIVWVVAIKKAADQVNEEINREATISYSVSGDAKNVDITYSTFGDSITTKEETAPSLPWSKEVKTKGLAKGGQLLVTTGEAGGSVTCTVLIDGKQVATNTASGQFALAACTGF